MRRSVLADGVRRLVSTLAFGGGVAAVVTALGTHDLEGYDISFFSLNRGTAVDTVRVLAQPVHTLALGLGVRLPLHGSLGASPAAALAPYLPAPITYWLLLALTISGATLLVRHALEPLCGRVGAWLALLMLFCSAPIVNYTIFDDWPENAVTYPAYVACVFAPHALLSLLDSTSSIARRLAAVAVAAMHAGLITLAHPGHWPLLAASLVLAWALALGRSDYPLRTRLAVVAGLAAVSFFAVVLQAPDIIRELNAARPEDGGMRRLYEGAQGRLLGSNLFPFGEIGARLPFTYLFLTLASFVIGLTSKDPLLRRLTVAAALISVALGAAAATIFLPESAYIPSITWALRDPATAFAVFSAACATAAVRRSSWANRSLRAGPALTALGLAGLQGPAYATGLVVPEMQQAGHSLRWNQDMTSPAERAARRGLAPDRIASGARMAFWPGVRHKMRNDRGPTTDFADAGSLLVTAWTKERTMRHLVEPNEYLFNQEIDLSSEVLCDSNAVRFLQLRYLLRPSDVAVCAPWTRVPDLTVDSWLEVDVARDRDDRVRVLPVARLGERLARRPGLSAGSELLPALVPLERTSLTIDAPEVVFRLDDPRVGDGHALVLPVAYDEAWRASSGQTENVAGLVGIVGVDQREVRLAFVPDVTAVLRAVSMTLAQALTLVGLLGLPFLHPAAREPTGITSTT